MASSIVTVSSLIVLLLCLHIKVISSQLCPTRVASQDIKAGGSFIVFHPPSGGPEVRIAYEGSSWPKDGAQTLTRTGFNASLPTLMYLHAFTQSNQSPWLKAVRNIYDTNSNKTHNLLFFDWSKYSQMQYNSAASYVPKLGSVLGDFLVQMNQTHSYNMTNMTIVSYSLSPHIAGLAGRKLEQLTGYKLGQIVALDPTGVCFHQNTQFAKQYSLQGTDAQLVVSRHYDMGVLGSGHAIGGLDILINGGKNQPGKSSIRYKRQAYSGGDSHNRAIEHEVGLANDGDGCHEMAYSCRGYEAYLAGECASCGSDNTKCYYVGETSTSESMSQSELGYPLKSKMYLKTLPSSPFCLHTYQLLVQLKAGASSRSRDLLKSGLIKLKIAGKTVTPKHGSKSSGKYTALLTSSKRLKDLDNVKLVVASSVNLKLFSNTLKYIELNYMSNRLASERKVNSAKYCLNSSGSLERC